MSTRARRTKFTLQSPPTGTDTAGDPSGSWTTVATVYGDERYLRGLETIKGGAEASIASASVNIAWRATITAGWRLLKGATVYEIKAVLPHADKSGMDLACTVTQ